MTGAAALATAGCVPEKARPRLEDVSRRAAPLPVCILPLPARGTAEATAARRLTDEQIWKAVFPSFDEQKGLPAGAKTCTDRPLLEDAAFRTGGAEGRFPFRPGDDDLLLGSGGDRLKVAWLRTHRAGDGEAVGALAVVRALDRFAEVYGVGVLRGRREGLELGTERLGGEFVVTAREDGCAERKPQRPCEALLHVFLPREGRLEPVASVATRRVDYARVDRAGAVTEYELATLPRFDAQGLVLSEQVIVRDEAGREVRKREEERACPLTDRGMVCSDDSLWTRMFPKRR